MISLILWKILLPIGLISQNILKIVTERHFPAMSSHKIGENYQLSES